jgi:hypothetical protein
MVRQCFTFVRLEVDHRCRGAIVISSDIHVGSSKLNEVSHMDEVDKIPFRADHVGSLLRPARLHEARRQFASGTLGVAALRRLEDEEISKVIARQEAVGLRAATDGEFRRASWIGDFVESVKGVPHRTGGSRAKWFSPAGEEIELAPIATAQAPSNAQATSPPSALRLERVAFDSLISRI